MNPLIDNRNPETPTSSRRPPRPWRELASRHSTGTTVGLYWRPEGDEISVQFSDGLTGKTFIVEPPKSAALAAFYHPYGFRGEGEGS